MDLESLDISERKLIVGLDFGTTYSGIAWAETRRPGKLASITAWPINEFDKEAESSDKCPTLLRYPGGQTATQWGFSIPSTTPGHESVAWFKLDLDSNHAPQDRSRSRDAARQDRTADDLVADYLQLISDHFVYMLRKKLGDGIVDTIPIEWVITVPAMWSDRAKQRTQRAAMKAPAIKDSTVHLVSEPEAAALFTLHQLDPHGLQVGDTFVTADAGGGTVDLISYTITKLKPVLEIEEAAPGSGGFCGASFLNERFEKFLRAKLGHLTNFDDELMGEAMYMFETRVKRHFTVNTSAEERFIIPVAGLANNSRLGIHRGRFSLLVSDVRTIFEPVISEVVRLVKDQIAQSRAKAKSVLLVGGFGASPYLRERIREAIDGDIQILQPPDGWTAVVRGAVLKGLANSSPQLRSVAVVKRKARRSYGTEISTRFSPDIHRHIEERKYWAHEDQFYRIDVMRWFVKRWQTVTEDISSIPISFRVRRKVIDGPVTNFGTQIYCDDSLRELRGSAQDLPHDSQMRLLGYLEADVSDIPIQHVKVVKAADGLDYYHYDCEARATFFSASTRYTLWYKGEQRGTVNLEYA